MFKPDSSDKVVVFENSTGTCLSVYITMVLGQPARLSKEACLYADADWLKPICQSHSEDIESHIMVRGGERSVL